MPEPSEISTPMHRGRARRRATAEQGPPQVTPAPSARNPALSGSAPQDVEPNNSVPKERRRRETKSRARPARADHDRDLASATTSQVGPTGAMRARDLNRPTAEDLAEAEADLTIVRRSWDPVGEVPQRPPRRRRT